MKLLTRRKVSHGENQPVIYSTFYNWTLILQNPKIYTEHCSELGFAVRHNDAD